MAPAERALVITGASSGIGEACATHFAARGYLVYAGVRNDQAADRLRAAHPSIVPVTIDVGREDSVAAAAEYILGAQGRNGIVGLVNNAGIAVAAPLEFLPLDMLREQLEINVIGQLAVTQRLMPLLRTARGRIINMGSVSGRVALPFMGPYSASKFALEALTESMRVEVRPWGIHVCIVEPGVIATPIWRRGLAAANAMLDRLPAAALELYGGPVEVMRRRVGKLTGAPVGTVVRAVAHALEAPRPRARYVVGMDARLRIALNWLPWRMRDAVVHRALRD